jgi:hypothetical protein
MFILRLLAVAFLVIAAIAVGAEFVEWFHTGAWVSIAAGQFWYSLHAASLAAVHAFILRDLHPSLWDPVMTWILSRPAWAVTGVPGLLLLWLDIAISLHQPRARRRSRFRPAG